ncbi:hypothetical protein H5410_012976 [Solanum commersonii]|uniref:Uncharacterized protein n=1 Tax=Solanum commersonii TaxID=4109 RepID=A0A9J6AT72_SOLCO|nr:hypothetical protein H5410_012976 [Solanum commersonii]
MGLGGSRHRASGTLVGEILQAPCLEVRGEGRGGPRGTGAEVLGKRGGLASENEVSRSEGWGASGHGALRSGGGEWASGHDASRSGGVGLGARHLEVRGKAGEPQGTTPRGPRGKGWASGNDASRSGGRKGLTATGLGTTGAGAGLGEQWPRGPGVGGGLARRLESPGEVGGPRGTAPRAPRGRGLGLEERRLEARRGGGMGLEVQRLRPGEGGLGNGLEAHGRGGPRHRAMSTDGPRHGRRGSGGSASARLEVLGKWTSGDRASRSRGWA